MTTTAYSHHYNNKRLTLSAEKRANEAVRNLQEWTGAVEEIRSWPEYSTQPLHVLDRTARELGLAGLFYKDESQRFGRELGSFKALGAPYTIAALLRDEVARLTGKRPTAAELRTGKYRNITERVTVCVATDGNQGRGLAYGAREFGCRCVIYIHGHVSPGRKEAIEKYGAIVIRIDGEYEASVARAKEDARMNNWHFVSSTSWDDFKSPLPRYVMNAYMVMVEEALAQLPDVNKITHVFAQGGVGSIAAAIYLGFKQRCEVTPRFVMVEPVEADCLYQSAVNGKPTPSSGSLHTISAGLACREVSPAAWNILEWLGSDFIRIPDSWVVSAMKALADGGGDTPIVSGESAAGGMGVVLKAAADHPELRKALGLDASSQVVLFGCEGATDPEIYERVVGCKPETVFDRQAKK